MNIQDFTLLFKYQSTVYPNNTKFTSHLSKEYTCFSYIYRFNSETQIRLKLILPRLHTSQQRTTLISILQLHHKINTFLRFHILTSLLNFGKDSNFLKFSQMINQTLVQLIYNILQIILQHYLQDILDISKFQ